MIGCWCHNHLLSNDLHRSLAEDLLCSSLDDTASDGKVGALLKEQVHLASSHATFVNAPNHGSLADASKCRGIRESLLTRQ